MYNQKRSHYFAILFKPDFVDVSVVTDGKNLAQFLCKDKMIPSVDLSFTLDASYRGNLRGGRGVNYTSKDARG